MYLILKKIGMDAAAAVRIAMFKPK